MATKSDGTNPGHRVQHEGGQRQKPAHEIRYGRVKSTIWRNSGKDGDWFSVTLTRSYRDGQGHWKQAATLGKDDLLVAAQACEQAWAWIAQQTASKPDGSGGTDVSGDVPF